MLETLKTQDNYKKQRTLKKQRNCIIQRQRCHPLRGVTFPRSLCTSGFFTRNKLAAWPSLAAARPGPARRPPDRCPAIARSRIVMLGSHMNSHTKTDLTAQNFGCRLAFWDVCGFKLFYIFCEKPMHTCETALKCFLREVYRSPERYTSPSTNSLWI